MTSPTKHLAAAGAGAGIIAFVAVLWIAFVYFLADLFYSIFLTLGVRLSGAESWSYWHTVFHWGLLVPLAIGVVRGFFSRR